MTSHGTLELFTKNVLSQGDKEDWRMKPNLLQVRTKPKTSVGVFGLGPNFQPGTLAGRAPLGSNSDRLRNHNLQWKT